MLLGVPKRHSTCSKNSWAKSTFVELDPESCHGPSGLQLDNHGRFPSNGLGGILVLAQGHGQRTSVGSPRLRSRIAAETAVPEPARYCAGSCRGADLLSVCTAGQALGRF